MLRRWYYRCIHSLKYTKAAMLYAALISDFSDLPRNGSSARSRRNFPIIPTSAVTAVISVDGSFSKKPSYVLFRKPVSDRISRRTHHIIERIFVDRKPEERNTE